MEHSTIKFRSRTEKDENGKTRKDAKGNSIIKYYDVVVYYCNYSVKGEKEKKELVINTGVQIEPENLTENQKIRTKTPNYQEKMEMISEVKERVESAYDRFEKNYKQKPTCNQLEAEYKKPVVKEVVKLEYFKEYFEEFLKKKKARFTNKVTGEVKKSYNVYKSCLTDIEQYENYKRKKLILNDLEDFDFWDDFIPYLLYTKPDLTRVKAPRKGMNDNTLLKRIKTYSEFFRWLQLKEVKINYYKIIEHIKEVKKNNEVVGFDPEKFSLTIDELQFLINFKPTKFEKEKDLAVFMTLQGVRISDLITLKDTDVVKTETGWEIDKISIKTGNEFKCEMHEISMAIWLKYDMNFDMWESDFNENIKVVMKEFFLAYKEHYDKTHTHKYDLTFIKKEKNGVISDKKRVFKYDIYSSHYGRVSFCSILGANEKLSLKELMLKTAHNDSRIALKYQKKTRDITAIELFPVTTNQD